MAEERIETVGVGDYRGYGAKNEFTHDLGVIVLPIASRTAGHRNIRLHGGIAKRTMKWRATRNGRPPIIPAAQNTEGDTLLSSTVCPRLPTPNKDGPGYDWDVSGEYVFVQNDPRVAGTNTFPVGQYPMPIEPAFTYGSQLAAGQVSRYYDSAEGNKFESLMERMADVATVTDGVWYWPFLALPSLFSSTHIIGG